MKKVNYEKIARRGIGTSAAFSICTAAAGLECGVHIATIYRELERGKIIVADSARYSADTAQKAIG